MLCTDLDLLLLEVELAVHALAEDVAGVLQEVLHLLRLRHPEDTQHKVIWYYDENRTRGKCIK